jgi:hypothetical protein
LAQMNPGRGAKRPRSIRLYAMQSGKGRILLRAVLPTCPGRQWLGLFRPQRGPDPNNRQFHGVQYGKANSRLAINTVLLIVVPGVALAWAEPQNFYGPNGQYQGSASAAKPSAAS